MRVPINPRTRAPNTQQGYVQEQRYVSPLAAVGAGLTGLAERADRLQEEEDKKKKQQEQFNIRKRILEEATNLDTDLTQRMEDAEPGAPGFFERYNTDLDARAASMLQEFREAGTSEDGMQELELRYAELSRPFRAKALDFRNTAENAKAKTDIGNMRDAGSRYILNNPLGIDSALAETVAAINANPSISQQEKQAHIEAVTKEYWNTAAIAYARQNPEAVLRAYDPAAIRQPAAQPTPPTGPAQSFQDVAHKVAQATGLPADQVAAVFSYETGGTFDPNIKGGKGGNHLGLIQFGKEERKKYGIKEGSTPDEWATAITQYMADRGFKPGMDILDFYSTINAGRPGRYSASDGNGTVRTHVDKILAQHVPKAQQWLGGQPAQESAGGMQAMPTAPEPKIPGNLPLDIRYKVKNPDGSISTVETISVGTDQGEVLIPTVVNGKKLSDAEAEEHFKQTGENFGTFNSINEATEYGIWLHTKHAEELGAEGDPILSRLSADQTNAALATARSEWSRREEAAKEEARAQTAAERAAYEERFNNLLNGLMDGRLNQADIDNAYRSGWLTDFDDRKKAQGIIDGRAKKNDDLALYSAMYKAGVKFNPYDDDHKAAAEAGYEAAIKNLVETGQADKTSPLMVAARLWEKTGIMVEQGAAQLRGGMISTDPNEVAAAASVASNMLARNPNAFAGIEGGEDIGQKASNYAYYVDTLGMTAEQAANKIALENSPEAKAKVKFNEPERNKFIKDISAQPIEKVINNALVGTRGVTNLFGLTGPDRGAFVATEQKAEASQTFVELATDHYDKHHDEGAAVSWATSQMARLYGIEGGRLMKFPPSKGYPEVNGSREYVYDQAAADVTSYVGFEVPKEDIFLVPTSQSANAFRSGRPIPYELHYITRKDGTPVYHVIPGKSFVADPREAQQQAAAEAREYEQSLRRPKIGSELHPGGLK